MERVCKKCGGSGPFPPRRRVCRKCISEASVEWQKRHPEKFRARMQQWRKNNPEKAADLAQSNYERRRDSGKIDNWKKSRREIINRQAREGYWRRKAQK